MCGRFSQYTPRKDLAEIFKVSLQSDLSFSPRYNIAPTQTVTTTHKTDKGGESVALMPPSLPKISPYVLAVVAHPSPLRNVNQSLLFLLPVLEVID
jgi:hypothetical protein